MKAWITLLVSVPIGAFSSLIAWWVLNHWIKPKIKFSNDISKLTENDKAFYRFKFENNGRRRILDSLIVAKLRIKGLKYPNNWEIIHLPLDNDCIPIIKSIKKTGKKLRVVPRLELGLIDTKYFRYLSIDIQDKIQNDTIKLEELMKLGHDAELVLFVTGYDEISGARKTFESIPYKIRNVKSGRFDNLGLSVKD